MEAQNWSKLRRPIKHARLRSVRGLASVWNLLLFRLIQLRKASSLYLPVSSLQASASSLQSFKSPASSLQLPAASLHLSPIRSNPFRGSRAGKAIKANQRPSFSLGNELIFISRLTSILISLWPHSKSLAFMSHCSALGLIRVRIPSILYDACDFSSLRALKTRQVISKLPDRRQLRWLRWRH